MPTRNPADTWRALVDETADDAIDEAANVPVAQAERELAAAGFDVAAERAKADAILASLPTRAPSVAPGGDSVAESEAWVTKAEPPKPPSRAARWPWLLAAALAIGTAGGVIYALGHRSTPVPPLDVPREGPTAVPTAPEPPRTDERAPSPRPQDSKPPMPAQPAR